MHPTGRAMRASPARQSDTSITFFNSPGPLPFRAINRPSETENIDKSENNQFEWVSCVRARVTV